MARAETLRRLLASTSLPAALVDDLLAETNALWLMGESDETVASELVLCHPPLEREEVRAVVYGTDDPGIWRITVVVCDRPGLLAATAGVLANEGLSITAAAVTVLPSSRMAVQRITVSSTPGAASTTWDRLGARLRAVIGCGGPVDVTWHTGGTVSVDCHPQGSGRTMVQVEAPDTVGLLWAVAAHLNQQGANIEAARLGNEDGVAKDVFIVVGGVDARRLATALSGDELMEAASRLGRILTAPLVIGTRGLRLGAELLGRGRPHSSVD